MGKRRRCKKQGAILDSAVSGAIEEIRHSGRYVEVSLERRIGYNACSLFQGFAYCVPDGELRLLNGEGPEHAEKLPLTQIKDINILAYGLKHSHGVLNPQLGYVRNHKGG